MLTFLRSLFADSHSTGPAPRKPRLGLECLEGRAVPAVLIIDTPPIIPDTIDNDTPVQTVPPNWAPSTPPFNGTMAPTIPQQPPFTDTMAPTQPPFNGTMTPTQTPPNWAPTLP